MSHALASAMILRRFRIKMCTSSSGVAGNADYADDSPLYGAMGFVRKSERKSGLTKKKKTP